MERTTDARLAATVAICTLNRREILETCLTALAAQSDPGIPWEILVVDNGSDDGTAEYVESAAAASAVPMRRVFEPRRGLSYARNMALECAGGAVILFIDDDFTGSPGWLSAHLHAFENPNVVGTGGRIFPKLHGDVPSWLPPDLGAPALLGLIGSYDYGDEPLDIGGGDGAPRLPFGGNMGIRTAVARHVGSFRVDLGLGREQIPGEETEFYERIQNHGRLRYLPAAFGDHHVDVTKLTPERFDQYHFGLGRSQVRMHPHASRVSAARGLLRDLGKAVVRVVRLWLFGGDNLKRRAAWACTRGRVREGWHQLRLGPNRMHQGLRESLQSPRTAASTPSGKHA